MSLQHLHKRKSIATANTLLDRVVYVSGFLSLAIMIPQVSFIYRHKIAAGFEPVTWGVLATLNIPWIVYGIRHKEPPIYLTYWGWLIVNTLVFIGAVIY